MTCVVKWIFRVSENRARGLFPDEDYWCMVKITVQSIWNSKCVQPGHARNENGFVPNLESSPPLLVREELSLFHPVAVLFFVSKEQ